MGNYYSKDWLVGPKICAEDKPAKKSGTKKSRNLCITYWVKQQTEESISVQDLLEDGRIVYGIRSPLERCPETGRLHRHYYLELKQQQRYSAVKKWFKDDTIHIEERFASAFCARNYCTKMYYSKKRKDTKINYTAVFEDEHEEAGTMKNPGRRTDWISLYEFIRHREEVPRFREVADAFPQFAVKFERHIKRSLATLRREKAPLDINRETHIIFGDPGTGKDHEVYAEHGRDNVYELCQDEDGKVWWDGYEGQDVLLISDFKWWLTRARLLNLTGSRPSRVNTKGAYETWTGTKVYITSNFAPEKWYPQSWDGEVGKAFASRVNSVERWDIDDPELEKVEMPKLKIVKRLNYRARKKRMPKKEGGQYYPPTPETDSSRIIALSVKKEKNAGSTETAKVQARGERSAPAKNHKAAAGIEKVRLNYRKVNCSCC